jgi:hypothetical protein
VTKVSEPSAMAVDTLLKQDRAPDTHRCMMRCHQTPLSHSGSRESSVENLKQTRQLALQSHVIMRAIIFQQLINVLIHRKNYRLFVPKTR